MNTFKRLGVFVGLACSALLAATVNAQDSWSLDNEASSLAFVTTKLEHIAEVLSFKELSGGIEADGTATLVIDVNSIDAIFELRDDRMKEFLFDASNFPAISISTQVDMAALGALGSGETAAMTLQTTMSLLGADYPVPAEVLVTNTGDGLVVSSVKPVLLSVPISFFSLCPSLWR